MITCFDCTYWDPFHQPADDPAAGVGHCCRRAPFPMIQASSVQPNDGQPDARWPITQANQGCGEAKEEEGSEWSREKAIEYLQKLLSDFPFSDEAVENRCFARVLELDLANIVRKAATGQPLTPDERSRIEQAKQSKPSFPGPSPSTRK